MTPGPLVVVLSGQVVAHVEHRRAGTLRLTYEPGTAIRTPVSLSLPPQVGTFTGDAVENFLWGLLPDNPRVLAAIGARTGADPYDPISLLAAVGKDCAGAVQLCPPEEAEATIAREGSLVPLTEADVEMRLAELRDEDAGWAMPGEHWSLGGSQQKIALRLTDTGWHEAHGAQPTSHILKPGVRSLTGQALVEHVSMRAAAACGIDVAATGYAGFKSESAIVVTRFDRHPGPGGSLVRSHQEDLCQSLGVREKYEDLGGPTASRIIRLLRDESRDRAAAEANVAAFVDALVFNVLIAAPDGHARNYAVLLDHDDVRLAPAFDVASGLAYDPPRRGRVMSMSVAGVFDPGAVTGEHWTRFAVENRLDPVAVLGRVHRYAEVIPAAVRTVLAEVDDGDGTAAALAERLLPALDAHVLTVTAQSGS